MGWEIINVSYKDGFRIEFLAMPEDEAPEGCIATGDDLLDAAWCQRIRSGELEWFVACVRASKAGVALAETYLGQCDYLHVSDFLETDHYQEMVREAVTDARAKIGDLAV